MSLADAWAKKAGELGALAWDTGQEHNQAMGVALQLRLLELADANPTIEEFSLDANYEYDDEGGYFWSGSIYQHGPDLSLADIEEPWIEDDTVRELTNEGSVFHVFEGQTFDGRITVARLRELTADVEPPPVDDEAEILRRAAVDARVLDKLNLLFSAPEWPGASGLEDVCQMIRATGRIEVEGAPRWERH